MKNLKENGIVNLSERQLKENNGGWLIPVIKFLAATFASGMTYDLSCHFDACAESFNRGRAAADAYWN